MTKKLIRYIGEYKLPTILTPLFILGETVIEALIPFVIADLVNSIQAGCELSLILKSGGLMFALACVSLACGGAAGYTAAKAAAGFGKNLRRGIFEKTQSFAFSNIDKYSSASLVTRMTTDVSNVQLSFMMIIRTAVRGPLMMLFCIVMAFRMGGSLALMFVVVVPVLLFGLLIISRKAMPAFRAVFRKYDKLNESVEENVSAMRVVKGFVREEYEKEKFDKASRQIRDDFTKAERIIAFNGPLMQLCLYFNMIFIMVLGSKTIIATFGENINVGQLSSLLTYGVQVLMSLMMLSFIYVILTISAESFRRIFEVLDEVPSLSDPADPVTEVASGSIDFENVSFRYSADAEADTLSHIDLHIAPGETVGIIGGTGSGKSSLVQLISRLYDVSEGSVKVGGRDVREYSLETLRNAVSVVLQKNVLFSGTIKDNLRWGDPLASDEEIAAACRLAMADDFIRAFPDGYDTMIEQGGANVSGGQKQRLCIARALLKKPKILILDDSTSAVDTATDAAIRKGFAETLPFTTKLINARRVSSVENADRILVMDGGRLVDSGTHEELLASSPIYREVYEEQNRKGDELP